MTPKRRSSSKKSKKLSRFSVTRASGRPMINSGMPALTRARAAVRGSAALVARVSAISSTASLAIFSVVVVVVRALIAGRTFAMI